MNNDFHQTHTIFQLFEGLELKDIAKPQHEVKDQPAATNGSHSVDSQLVNGHANGEAQPQSQEAPTTTSAAATANGATPR